MLWINHIPTYSNIFADHLCTGIDLQSLERAILEVKTEIHDTHVMVEATQRKVEATQQKVEAQGMVLSTVHSSLPSATVTHVITPSQASTKPKTVESVFETLGINLVPVTNDEGYDIPNKEKNRWTFDWKWPEAKTPKEEKGGGNDDLDDVEGDADDLNIKTRNQQESVADRKSTRLNSSH